MFVFLPRCWNLKRLVHLPSSCAMFGNYFSPSFATARKFVCRLHVRALFIRAVSKKGGTGLGRTCQPQQDSPAATNSEDKTTYAKGCGQATIPMILEQPPNRWTCIFLQKQYSRLMAFTFYVRFCFFQWCLCGVGRCNLCNQQQKSHILPYHRTSNHGPTVVPHTLDVHWGAACWIKHCWTVWALDWPYLLWSHSIESSSHLILNRCVISSQPHWLGTGESFTKTYELSNGLHAKRQCALGRLAPASPFFAFAPTRMKSPHPMALKIMFLGCVSFWFRCDLWVCMLDMLVFSC